MSKRAHNVVALGAGTLFGFGLMLCGMVDPQRVLGFLDVTGRWDPTLVLVMAGGVAASALPIRLAMRRGRPLLGGMLEFPSQRAITGRLVAGSVMFGVGWGLCGVCPGPALLNLLSLRADRWEFFVSMLAGMLVFDAWNRRVVSARTVPASLPHP
ncbi:DUF6691 family protein [Thiomonas sp.]|jgi:uncharacterized membrane protein YedE/YeeE|uniref:DUF6691 family protein n=1 Tax=Thiomonas sp. TaxID=2047785 RepID=UPI002632D23C|nr:DUF6691 family protein [Thiomonas sp.]